MKNCSCNTGLCSRLIILINNPVITSQNCITDYRSQTRITCCVYKLQISTSLSGGACLYMFQIPTRSQLPVTSVNTYPLDLVVDPTNEWTHVPNSFYLLFLMFLEIVCDRFKLRKMVKKMNEYLLLNFLGAKRAYGNQLESTKNTYVHMCRQNVPREKWKKPFDVPVHDIPGWFEEDKKNTAH